MNEAAIEGRLALLLDREPASIAETMGWPSIISVERQVKLGAARLDIAVRHVDQSVSIIEVKDAALPLRDYCTGIGQLAYQRLMAVSHFQTLDVRAVLAVPPPYSVDLILLAFTSKVDLLPVPSDVEWTAILGGASAETAGGPTMRPW